MCSYASDFIELMFPRAMYPAAVCEYVLVARLLAYALLCQINIFETYNPGSVVRILCCPYNPTPGHVTRFCGA